MIVIAVPSICHAQTAAASTLKAAFILNFVKFTQWGDLKSGQAINVCVPAQEMIADAMTSTMRGQSIDGRDIRVIRMATDDVAPCQLLFVTEREPRRLTALLDASSRTPMLTVSDVEESANHGVVIELFLESGRLRFAINIDSMERSHVKVSSRLLMLAKIVRDGDRH
jgi:hypothetical protein